MILNRPAAGPSPTPTGPILSDTSRSERRPEVSTTPTRSRLFEPDADNPSSVVGPNSIVVPPPTEPEPQPWEGRVARLAELVDWRDLLGAPGDTTPLLRRPRVLVLLGAITFALSPFVAAVVRPEAPAIDRRPVGAKVSPTSTPLPTLSPPGPAS